MDVLILYLGITIIGYFIGAFLKKKGAVLRGTGVIQTAAITVLVFLMGSKIGADEEIVKSLDAIGLKAFIMTVFIFAGSVAAVFLARKLMGFDREGNMKKAVTELNEAEAAGCPESGDAEAAKNDHTMTICILVSVACGILAGYLVFPDGFIALSGTLIVIGLCMLLLFVGIDIGTEGTIVESFKQAGWRIIVFPFVIIAGTFIGAAVSSIVLPVSVKDAQCVGAGFGWYTLAPAMLAEYSVEVSAMSFMHNVMRELIGILLIPIVAKKIGYIETVSLPGAASMDVCLPVVEKATKSDIAVFSFVSGAVLSIAVPVMVSFVMGL